MDNNKQDKQLSDLMAKAQDGDMTAYRSLLNESSRLIRGFLAKRLSTQQDIEDVMQEVLMAIHKARHTYHNDRPFKPWLFAISHYKLQDYLRIAYRKKDREIVDTEIIQDFAADDVTIHADNSEELNMALSSLGDTQHQIIRKTKIEGYTNKEVADQLGMTESAVKVASHRAMKKLKIENIG